MQDEMIGKIFGKWTVLEKTEHRNSDRCIMYLCKCECGTIKEVSGVNLRRGKSKSCGCYKKASINLTGLIFDKLTVLERIDNKNNKEINWLCQCECGNTCIRTTYQLRNKAHFHSCGCYTKEQAKTINPGYNLINKKFNFLTVKELLPERNNRGDKLWRCQCDCGNKTIVSSYHLINGEVASCGCIKQSIGEKHIEDILKNNNINYKKEYTIKELNYKRFDFAIKDNDNNIIRLIEFDGRQHYNINNIFNTKNSYSFEEIQNHDKEKNDYALSYNIPLVRIPYWERDNITLEMIMGDQYLVKKE